MAKKKVSDIKTRRLIYQYIEKYPGLHKRELVRLSQVPYSTLDYHIFILNKRNLVKIESDKQFIRYYASGKIGSRDKEIINVLRQSAPRDIILFLIINPSSTHETLRNHLKLAPSTTSYHIKKLMKLNITNSERIGKESVYCVIDPDYITDILVSFKSTFLSKTVDQFVKTIVDIHPKYLRKARNEEKK